jgi:Uma2 family endonuclease
MRIEPDTDVPSSRQPSAALPLRLSYEAFLDWLDEDEHAERVAREVVRHGPVSFSQNRLGGFLIAAIESFAEKHGLGELAYAPFQMKTGPNLPSRAPDILFVTTAHLWRLRPNLLEGPADLVVEIVSPESRGRDRGDKFYEYEQGGVRAYGLIDPERMRAEFYLLGDDGRYAVATLDGDRQFHSTVLPGFGLTVDWLWQDPLPTQRDIMKTGEI